MRVYPGKITEWPRQREVVLEEKNHDARLAADSNFSVTIYPNFRPLEGKILTTTRYHNTIQGVVQ